MQKEIIIPKPCSENWNKMTTSEQGKFCQNCQKNVVDFTQKSDKEVLDILAKSKGNLCGRFTKQQLSTPFVDYAAPSRMSFGQRAAGVLLATSLLAVGAEAQTSRLPSKIIVEQKAVEKTVKKGKEKTPKENFLKIEGVVKDAETGKLLSNANIRILEPFFNIKSNKDGKFSIKIPFSEISKQQKEVYLSSYISNYEGFSRKIELNERNKDKFVKVEMKMKKWDNHHLMGDVMISPVKKNK